VPTTLDFLAHVLPDDGYYCFFQIENRVHRWFDRLADLGSAILEADAQGRTVYHACASYREASRRAGENVQWLGSLWLDIDAGVGKPYEDRLAAQIALFTFCQETGLPPPTLVGSGGGLHAYWPLAVQLDRRSWLPLSRGLRALCAEKSLAIDPARTCDAASVLRTPGTHWRKGGAEREVIVGLLNGPYEIGELDVLREASVRDSTTRYNGHQFRAEQRVAESLSQFYPDEPSVGRTIAASCKQLSSLCVTRGALPEPLRYACFGVLAYCADGEQIALENNQRKSHEPYSREEIQAKLDQWKSKAEGPATCTRFAILNPAGCQGCPHQGKITSPIQLGREGQKRMAEPVRQTEIPQQIKLPFGFDWGDGGQLMAVHEETKDGQTGNRSLVLSTYKLYLDAVQTGEVRNSFNLVFKHTIPDRGEYDINIPAGDLFSSSGASLLAEQGANVHDHNQFLRYVRGHVDMLYRDQQIDTQFEQFGWKEDDTAFLYGLDLYAPDGVHRVPGSDELRLRSRDSQVGPAQGGSAEAWTDAVDTLFAAGHEPQSAAILASFGAPLVRFLDKEEGGAILHFTTAETGKGKTWALMGAWTVWGRKDGLSLTSKDTKTSKGLSLGALGNLPVFHDELTSKDPSVIREFIEVFTDGRDKLRATRSGEIRHSAARWQTLLLSASNVSIVDTLTQGNVKDAMTARVIELGGVQMKNVDFHRGEQLKKIMTANSGHAGHAYLQYLVQPEVRQFVIDKLDDATKRLWDTGKFDSTHRYWVRALACMDIGGSVAKHLGLIRVDVRRVMNWLYEQVTEMPLVRPWAVETLAEYLLVMREHTLVVDKAWHYRSECRIMDLNKKDLRVRYEADTRRYVIAKDHFRKWVVERQQNCREMLNWLQGQGVVRNKHQLLTLAAGTHLAGPQTVCVTVDGMHSLLTGVEEPAGVKNVVVIHGKR
jgi:hypothetical protein